MSTKNQEPPPLALILGGSSGIGLAAGRRLAARGISVHLVARPTPRLDAARAALQASAPDVEIYASGVDFTDRDAVAGFAAQLRDDGRPLTYLVNAAGTFAPKPFLAHEPADYDRYLELNRATFFLTQAVAARMVARGGGSIVNIGSMWAKQAIKATPSSAYSMAKAGLHAFTQHLAMELGDHGVRVNAVSPGPVETPIYQKLGLPPEQLQAMAGQVLGNVPLGRFGQPDEIAAALAFAASKDASFMVGEELVVDGGWTGL